MTSMDCQQLFVVPLPEPNYVVQPFPVFLSEIPGFILIFSGLATPIEIQEKTSKQKRKPHNGNIQTATGNRIKACSPSK